MAFDYLRLVFVSVLAYLFFVESISWQTAIGSLIILAGALLALHRERYLKKIQIV
jgi:drug/metabolite transporter (DMT)-like permease